MSFGLYVHYPYCLQQCSYCDFATDLYKNEEKNEEYLQALTKELLLASETPLIEDEINTIYFGGGTPSLLSPKELHDFFNSLYKLGYQVASDAEITIEINPDTVDSKKLKEFRDLGIKRFSLGAQTLNDNLLNNVGRLHQAKDTLKNLEELRQLEVNFSCDLLFALPKQSLKQVEHDLKRLLDFEPQHISPYILTLPEKHPLQKDRPSEEIQSNMMAFIRENLLEAGYEHYEISNYAKPGFHSKHNYNAWKGGAYWGIGMSAHSYLPHQDWGVRFHNPPTVNAYKNELAKRKPGFPYKDKASARVELLKKHEALSDFCHTSLRLQEGIDFEVAEKRFGSEVAREIKRRSLLDRLSPYLEKTTKGVKLNWEGILFSNLVFEDFVFLKEEMGLP